MSMCESGRECAAVKVESDRWRAKALDVEKHPVVVALIAERDAARREAAEAQARERVLRAAFRWFRMWPEFKPNPARLEEACADVLAARPLYEGDAAPAPALDALLAQARADVARACLEAGRRVKGAMNAGRRDDMDSLMDPVTMSDEGPRGDRKRLAVANVNARDGAGLVLDAVERAALPFMEPKP